MKKPLLLLLVLSSILGCESAETEKTVEKKPRPVQVETLVMRTPESSSRVAAVVASWKTEEVGMEVGGRIQRVVEPNTDIEARVVDDDGNVVVPGTPIAWVDQERFELQVQSAEAEVNRAKQAIKAANIELSRTIPSQIRAAEAEKKRAQTEYDRSVRLVKQNAGSQSDVDRDEATLQNTVAQLEQLNAQTIAKAAELKSLNSALLQAEKALEDAERSLKDCVLYSSFRGQISDVSVVPGSVVTAGQAIATLQMMDPIKIEVEVSAEDSRRLRNRQRLPVMVTMEDGTTEEQDGFLYLVDPVADSQTRTFTLTLLMMNKRLSGPSNDSQNAATTDQCWRTDFPFLPGAEQGKIYAPLQAIREDSEGHFVWRIKNVTVGQSLPQDCILQVEKMPLTLGTTKLPFLGNWIFQEIEITDSTFLPSLHLIAGQLSVEEGDPNYWNGTEMVVDKGQGQWMLRPGDLVEVDLSNSSVKPGLFVPMDAVSRQDGNSYLFIVEEQDSKMIVKRTPIEICSPNENQVSTTLQIQANDDSLSLTGKQFVTKGTHYLNDGETVRVVSSETN